jgi:hypothetical protein
MAATAAQLVFAAFATVLAAMGAASPTVGFALVATGVVCAAVITPWGFARVRWEAAR